MASISNIREDMKRNQPTLYILCGLPYSGKTYIAEQVLKDMTLVFVSIDKIFAEAGFDWDTNTLPNQEEWQEIFDTSYEQTREALRSGKSVLYDSTNQTRSSRDVLRTIADACRVDAKVICIDTPVATVWKRWEENQRNPSRPQVAKELVQSTIDMFEAPSEDEKVMVMKNE